MNPFRSLFLSLSRMPPILMLFIIIGLAVVVTFLVTGKMNESEQQKAQMEAAMKAEQNKKSTVVYAIKDINEGDVIAQDAVEERQVDAGKTPVDACISASQVVGQTAAYPIQQNSVVSSHAIKTAQVVTGFDAKIKDGMRAVTFGVDANAGVAGFIAPGSRVDVIAITGTNETTKAAPVMSDVEVIAVGAVYNKAPGAQAANAAGSVTVTVSPEDANKLIKAYTAAKLYLTLRNDKDHNPVAVVDVNSMFPKAPKPPAAEVASLPPPSLPPPPLPGAPGDAAAGGPPAPPPPPPMHEIEVWTGSKKEVLSVPQG